jgi:hypothetical protein
MKLNGGRWKIFIRSYTEVILKLNGGMPKLEEVREIREGYRISHIAHLISHISYLTSHISYLISHICVSVSLC